MGKIRFVLMKYFLTIVLFHFQQFSFGQPKLMHHKLIDSSLNFLYIGVNNPISIIGDDKNYKLKIRGEGCYLQKIEKNHYVIRVNGDSELCELTVLKGAKNIFRRTYLVKHITGPIATVNGFRDTTISAKLLLENPYIAVIYPTCFLRSDHFIYSFNATFIQGYDSLIMTGLNAQFSDAQIRMTYKLKSGDKIYFDRIRGVCGECQSRWFGPFWIRIE